MQVSLVEGRLSISGLSESQLKKLYKKFRIDLLDSNITHYRPVAFKMEGALATSVQSNISKIPGFGYSFSELSFILNNIITSEKRGIMPEQLNATASISRLKSDCSFLTLMGDTIGTEVPESMFYCGEGLTSMPRMLLNDVSIFRKLKTSVAITVILMKGKGKNDFSDNQRLIWNTGFKPMRTHYSLYEYISVREYVGGSFLTLDYKADINEGVLKGIIEMYLEQEEVLECLNLDQ